MLLLESFGFPFFHASSLCRWVHQSCWFTMRIPAPKIGSPRCCFSTSSKRPTAKWLKRRESQSKSRENSFKNMLVTIASRLKMPPNDVFGPWDDDRGRIKTLKKTVKQWHFNLRTPSCPWHLSCMTFSGRVHNTYVVHVQGYYVKFGISLNAHNSDDTLKLYATIQCIG